MSRIGPVLTLILLGAIAGRARAQSLPRPMPAVGDSVRVWAESPELDAARGTVRRLATDTVVFTLRSPVSREWLDTPVETRNIRRIDIPDGVGRSRKRTVIGYAVGSVLGLGAGGYIAWRMSPLYCNTTPCPPNDLRATEIAGSVVGITLGAVAGASIGGAVGWAVGRRPIARWRQVYPEVRP